MDEALSGVGIDLSFKLGAWFNADDPAVFVVDGIAVDAPAGVVNMSDDDEAGSQDLKDASLRATDEPPVVTMLDGPNRTGSE